MRGLAGLTHSLVNGPTGPALHFVFINLWAKCSENVELKPHDRRKKERKRKRKLHALKVSFPLLNSLILIKRTDGRTDKPARLIMERSAGRPGEDRPML